MPMKPYVKTTKGTYTNKPWGSHANSYNDFAESTNMSLSGVVSNVGDKKRALTQAFTKTLDVRWTGSLYAESAGSSPLVWSRIVGVTEISPPSVTFPQFSNAAYNKAISDIYDQVRGSLDLSVDAFQSGQAKSMIKSAVGGVEKLVRVLQRMKRAPVHEASKLWLEYVYGWRPLAGSLYQTLDRLLQPDVIYVTARSRKQELVYHTQQSGSYNQIPYQFDLLESGRCEMEVNYKLSNTRLQALAGYTSLNPVSIAYELMTFSFVVDWFFDFGGYVRNLETAIAYGCDFSHGYYTQTALKTGEIYCKGRAQSGSLITQADLKYGVRYAKKLRTPLTVAPMPRAPVLNPQLGSGRILNALALAASFKR
jgi:hypothetical protein